VKGKAMSKIFEALENAEKERARAPRNGFVLGREPKRERTERHEENAERERAAGLKKESSLALEPREVKKTPLVLGPKEENKTAPVGPKEGWVERREENVGQRATELTRGPSPAVQPKEEKKILPVREPKEDKKTALFLEPKGERVEKPTMIRKPIRPDRMRSDFPLVSLFQPGSLGAEQFRRLRTHVLKLNVSDPPKTIMVTSATEGEGKTFVAANLAAGIAHDLHFHALLVDCDLRNPSISQWFGVQNGHGLSDYLVGRGQLPELLMKTEMEKLSILTGGSAQEKPAELIGSKRMEALVRELKSRYNDRYIILDATPLLATTEPEVLARLVDGILIVVRAGVTPRETVKQAIASLDPKKIMGFVLNDVEFKSSGLSSRYFGSDGYYTKYGYGKRRTEPRSQSGKMSPFKKKSD
jgi:exopolysaccharide/PEP-CTERM locus tyrosine autokinase